jgi:hypothetical protein
MFSLRKTLTAIGSHLPLGFDATHGIKTLLPSAYKGSISVLLQYIYFKTGVITPKPSETIWYTVGADGAGRWFFSWRARRLFQDINLRLQAGFVFKFSQDSFGHGYVDHSRPSLAGANAGICNSGVDNWITSNWPKIFTSDVMFDLQEATGFDSLPPESNIWTNAGFGQANFIALSGANVACVGQGSGSILFPLPTLPPDSYVCSIIASAQAKALSTNSNATIGIDSVRQVISSSSFQSSAKSSIQSYLLTPAAATTVSDAKIITNILANKINPGLLAPAADQVKLLSSQLMAHQVLAVAASVSVALSVPLQNIPVPGRLPWAVSKLNDALKAAGDAASDAVKATVDAAFDATNQALVNTGGNLEEMPLEILVDMAIWAGSNLIVDGPSNTAFDPVAPPDPSDAGTVAGAPDPNPIDGGMP